MSNAVASSSVWICSSSTPGIIAELTSIKRYYHKEKPVSWLPLKLIEVESACTKKVTGFNMDKGWCYAYCSRCTKKLQRTVSSFTWQPAVTPMQLVSFGMLDPATT
ncbi:hypothetical protein Rs2_21961 [Raphanus sativus]|nr:hypothetical protein Rs2_21961 [Raphanus sativus]